MLEAYAIPVVETLKAGTPEKIDQEPIGTGPYAIADWEYGQKLILARNDAYWGNKTVADRAEFTFKGAARLVAPLLAPAFKRLGDRAAERLGDVLS